MRQSATITGLGTKLFDSGVDNIAKAYMWFINHFPEDAVEHWQPSALYPHSAIDVSSRYFTEKKVAPHEVNIPFGPMVNPNGILARLQGGEYIHGQDNYVEYLEMQTRDGNTK